MKIGIMSDTHNDTANIIKALEVMKEQSVEKIIHCGDVTSPDTLWYFTGWDIDFAFGNVDHNRTGLISAAKHFGLNQFRDRLQLEIEGLRIGACHSHDFSDFSQLISSGLFDFIFYGHTHRRKIEKRGKSIVLNPGSLGGKQPQSRSIAIINTVNKNYRFYGIPDGKELIRID